MDKKIFKSQFNIMNGKDEWVMEDENYDYKQEIARSAYADMLHDEERNDMYYWGLREAIYVINNDKGRCARVLDIGTGTGLLSMMAVDVGADLVYACDAFKPAAHCARKIIEANGMSDKITVIEKRSTDLKIPEDLPCKFNVLVTEVFDTELIGEGAINTFRHALEHLLDPGAIVVPSKARMYIQPVESSLLWSYQHLNINLPSNLPEVSIPTKHVLCNNDTAAPVLDLQLSQLSASKDYKPLTKPIEVFQFDFMDREALVTERTAHQKITALQSGSCQAFFMWWSLSMDTKDEYILSCRPTQNCFGEEFESPNWRDHWMQAVYFPSKILSLQDGSEYTLTSKHDEYSLAFTINPADTPTQQIEFISDSTLHHSFIRSRFSLGRQSDKYYRALHKHNVENKTLLCLSDGSFLPFLAVHMGAQNVYCIETNFSTRDTLQDIINENGMKEKITLYDSIDDLSTETIKRIDIFVGEPYFQMCSLPWHDLWFWYSISNLTQTGDSVKILPEGATLYMMCVEFEDLHLIRRPVGKCHYDLTIYDHMIESARRTADEFTETHSLWEYPSVFLSEKMKVQEFDFTTNVYTSDLENIDKDVLLPIKHEGELNGIAFWIEYQLDSSDETSTVSCGLLGIEGKLFYKYHDEEVEYQRKPVWSKYHQQGVHLPARICKVSPSSDVKLNFKFNFKTADINMALTVDGEDTTLCDGVTPSDYFTRTDQASGDRPIIPNPAEAIV